MNNILQISTLFLAQLGFGSALVLPFFPLRVAGKSFVRFYLGLIVITLGLFLLCLHRLDQITRNYLIITALALWIWALSFRKNFSKIENALIWFFSFCSLIILYSYPARFLFHGLGLFQSLVPFTLLLSASIFLCFHLMNMIFGHWYLVNRDLPIDHLIKTSRNLVLFSYFRVVTVAISTYLAYDLMNTDTFNRLTDILGHGVFFWARILAGLGIPLLVAHLAYASAKIKSNQSATGILYAGCVFVLMGEIMALYLYTLTGIVW